MLDGALERTGEVEPAGERQAGAGRGFEPTGDRVGCRVELDDHSQEAR